MDKNIAKWNDEMYTKHSTPYHNGLAGWIQNARVRTVIRLASVRLNDSVLEVGCEAGGLLLKLPDCRKRLGVDISGKAMAIAIQRAAERNLQKVYFQKLDASKPMPFQQGRFNVIIASEILEHVHQPRKVLENIYAVLM